MTKNRLVELLAPSETWNDIQFDSIFLYLEKCVKGHRGALWAKLGKQLLPYRFECVSGKYFFF